jgi:DNA polymerase-3 subunit delta
MDELIYVIAGKEESLVNAHCREILDNLLEPSQRTTGLFNADAATASATDVLDELRTAPFLTDKRIVLIKEADAFISKTRELLEKYFDNPCPTGRLVMTVKSWDARTKLAKKLPKVGKLISVTPPKPWELPRFLIDYAQGTYNKRLDRDAAILLVELTGDELTRLYSEIDKLALYADADKVITSKHIELLIGHNRMFDAFSVIDTVISGDTGRAIERLRTMFESDKSTEYTVVGAFAYHLRRMFGAKAMLEKGVSVAEIEKKMRIWSNKDKFFSQLRKVSLRQVGWYLQQLAEVDFAIKTGRSTAPVAMEQFVLSLIAAAA